MRFLRYGRNDGIKKKKNMKRISILLGMMVVFAMASCDKLDEPYFVEPIVNESDTIALEAADTLNFDGKIVVLLEDYTGVKCPNCPAAAQIASSLQDQYGEHLIVMAVHPRGAQQLPAGGFPDFRTDDGNEWNNFFNISAYPTGTVNRNAAIGSGQWTSAVTDLIDNDAPVRLIVKTDYNDASRELKVSVHSKLLQDFDSDNLRLTVCMMEDNIIGKQLVPTSVNPSGVIDDYTHRHVFRGTADGLTWGRVLDSSITNMKFTLNEEYNADEFYIVAFISDNTTRQVLMAAERKIK